MPSNSWQIRTEQKIYAHKHTYLQIYLIFHQLTHNHQWLHNMPGLLFSIIKIICPVLYPSNIPIWLKITLFLSTHYTINHYHFDVSNVQKYVQSLVDIRDWRSLAERHFLSTSRGGDTGLVFLVDLLLYGRRLETTGHRWSLTSRSKGDHFTTMVICKFFQQGNCRYGNNCFNEHTYGGGGGGFQQQRKSLVQPSRFGGGGFGDSSRVTGGFSFTSALQSVQPSINVF